MASIGGPAVVMVRVVVIVSLATARMIPGVRIARHVTPKTHAVRLPTDGFVPLTGGLGTKTRSRKTLSGEWVKRKIRSRL